MVVSCEKCSTRFRLDESRIPPSGARVRCSRCKHAFFLAPSAGADAQDAIHAIAAQALDGGTAAPPPSEDLREVVGAPPPVEPRAAEVEPATLDDEDESRWEFSEAVRNEESEERVPEPEAALFERLGAGGATIGAPEGESAPAETPAAEPELGSPESWNLLGSSHDDGPAPGEPLELDPGREPEPVLAREPAPLLASAPLPERLEPAERAAPARWGRAVAAFGAAGWLVVAALVAVALEGILFPGRPASVTHRLRAGDVRAHDLRGRFVENALAGPLFLVSAELRNASAAPQRPGEALRVVLLAHDGSRLPTAQAWVAAAPDERVLREASPEAIRAGLERGARRLAETELAPDASVRVAALLEDVPAQAVRFALEEVPIAELPGEATEDTAATERASLPSPPSSPE